MMISRCILIVAAVWGACGDPVGVGGTDGGAVGGDSGGAGTGSDGGSGAVAVVFPIEVFGDAGHSVSVPFVLTSVDRAEVLYLKVHRPTWLEDGSFKDRGPKMAVRLAGGNWVQVKPQKVVNWSTWGTPAAGAFQYPVDSSNVHCVAADAQFGGCMSGTYHTIRFTITLAELGSPSLTPSTTVDFRFEGSDGISMGYRVLDLDVRTPEGVSLVDRTLFSNDDPDRWQPPYSDSGSIAEGKMLWTAATLTASPIDSTELNAKCSSCHAVDGRDLAYFNFSNYAISRRAQFHGLTAEQGDKIASFIRTLDLQLPAGTKMSALGRPWNPPYQPGPGLDAKPVQLWAAGAGLDAVLDDDHQMKDYLFPTGTNTVATSPSPGGAALPLLGGNGYLNPREMPQAFQYPDWNSWLPRIAPEDMTTDPQALIGSDWYKLYTQIRTALETNRDMFIYSNPATHTISQPNNFTLYQFSSGFPSLTFKNKNGLNWKSATTNADALVAANYMTAFGLYRNMRKWEVFNTFSLEQIEGLSQSYFAYTPPKGQRVWPTDNRDMFEIAPHFSGPGYPEKQIDFDGTAVGDFWSTSWYSLQQILNGGYQAMSTTGPVDWNYQVPHIFARPDRLGTDFFPWENYRAFWGVQFMLQAIPANSLQTDFDWPMGHIHDAFGTLGGTGSITPAETVQLNEVLAQSFLDVVGRFTLGSWPRKLNDGSIQDGLRLDDANTAPNQANLDAALASVYLPDVIAQECHDSRYANCYYLKLASMHNAKALTQPTMDKVVAWTKALWPLYHWSNLSP